MIALNLTLQLILSFIALLFSKSLIAEDLMLSVVPYPQEVEKRSGSFMLRPDDIRIQLAVSDTNGIALTTDELYEVFEIEKNQTQDKSSTSVIWLGFPAEDKRFERLCRQKGIWPESRIGEEGYVLLIEKNRIILAANEKEGLFYGVQTLKQLVRGRKKEDRLPCLKIIDWPEFLYRGMQDDISRGPIPTMEFMKTQIRRCAELKLNMLSYYIENVVATKSHGDFAPAGAAISVEEWRELSDFAEKYQIKLVGNFQSFSHFEKILSYPQYRHLGESGRLLSPLVPESYELLADIYAEMAPAFSSDFFNINSDETWDLGRGSTKQIVDNLGVAKVYANHLNRLYQELQKHNKRMMMWADIALEHKEVCDLLPKDIVMMTWEYSPLDSYIDYIKPLQNAGFEVMVCPGVLNSNRLMPELKMARDNIRGLVEEGARNKVMGVLLTIWDDGGMALFSRDWYGVAYAAEKSWNVDTKKGGQFDKRFNMAVYGDKSDNVTKSLWKIMELAALRPTQELNDKILKRKIIPERGQYLRINLEQWDRVLEICDEAEQLLAMADPKINESDLDYFRFTIEQYRFLAQSRMNILAAAKNYSQALELQTSDREQGRRFLIKAMDKVGKIEEPLIGIRNWFRRLWLQENNVYWLEHILYDYDKRLQDISDVTQHLFRAIADYDKGHFLPPPGEVRLDIEKASGDYFQGWLVCGPFPNSGGAYGSDIDYLEVMGGELNARPFAGEVITLTNDDQYRWGKFNSPEFGLVNLASYYQENGAGIRSL